MMRMLQLERRQTHHEEDGSCGSSRLFVGQFVASRGTEHILFFPTFQEKVRPKIAIVPLFRERTSDNNNNNNNNNNNDVIMSIIHHLRHRFADYVLTINKPKKAFLRLICARKEVARSVIWRAAS
jgi:hypothetical protein